MNSQSQKAFSWAEWYQRLHELAEEIRQAQAQAGEPAPSNESKSDSLTSQTLRRKPEK